MLNDKLIREALINRLGSTKLHPIKIIEEIAVKRGLAIADIVANYKVPHCFEIKSDVDSLSRLKKQSEIFSDVFPKITLVTTEKHLKKSLFIIPPWWGIMLASKKESGVTILKYYRRSGCNPKNTTKDLLNILWNDELKKLLDEIKAPYKQSENRNELANKINSVVPKKKAVELFVDILFERKMNLK
jgi:hypothetical protein